MLIPYYKILCVQVNKSIANIYTRFINIISCLKVLEQAFSDVDLVRKILKKISQNFLELGYHSRARDPDKFLLEKLIGSIITYELRLKTKPSISIINIETKNIAVNSNKKDRGNSENYYRSPRSQI